MLNKPILLTTKKTERELFELLGRVELTINDTERGVGLYPSSNGGVYRVLEGDIQFDNANSPCYCRFMVDDDSIESSLIDLSGVGELEKIEVVNEATGNVCKSVSRFRYGDGMYIFGVHPMVFFPQGVGDRTIISIYK